MKALFVTGSRHYTDRDYVMSVMQTHLNGDYVVVYHGNAPGLDRLVDELSKNHFGWPPVPMPAQWDEYAKHGKRNRAGPDRNMRMATVAHALAACGWDVVLEAFPLPNSRGTWDCVSKFESLGIEYRVNEKERTE